MEVLQFPFSAYPLIFAKFREYTFQPTKRYVHNLCRNNHNYKNMFPPHPTTLKREGVMMLAGWGRERSGRWWRGEGERVAIIHISYSQKNMINSSYVAQTEPPLT